MSTIPRRGRTVVIKNQGNAPISTFGDNLRQQKKFGITLNDRFSQLRNAGANAKAVGAALRRKQQSVRSHANRFANVMYRRTGRPKDSFITMMQPPIQRGTGLGTPGHGRLGRGGAVAGTGPRKGRGGHVGGARGSGRGGSRGGRGGGRGRGGRGGGGRNNKQTIVSEVDLNTDIESYMSQSNKSQSKELDADIDQYMHKS